MNVKKLITAAALVALPIAANAATLVVPVAGTGPGANNSQWQSELTLHNAAPRPATVTISFRQGTGAATPVTVTLQARETVAIADVVQTKFNVAAGNGALVIDIDDRDARSIAVTSRTFNASTEGEFGQDIPAVNVADATRAGDVAALSGPSNVGAARFNFGLYSIDATTIEWRLVRASGTVAATKTLSYVAGQHVQYNGGVEALFAQPAANSDTVQARLTLGKAVFYGSAINNDSGDPTFIPGIRTREDVVIHFTGVDLDENGTVDVRDDDGDGVLDSSIEIVSSLFPSYFRLVAEGEFAENVQFAIVSSPAEAHLLDTNGTLIVAAGGDVKGTEGEIVIRATTPDGSSSLFTIPVRFR